jgi:putative ABC transport system permease protein
MIIRELIRIAWKSINSNKLRSLLTMLGVIIGVSAVIIMVAISAGTEATIAERITGLGANLIFINPSFSFGGEARGASQGHGGGITLTYEDARAIDEKVNGVVGVSVEQRSSETVKAGTVIIDDISIIGTTPDFPSVRDIPVGRGRFFTEKELDRSTKVAVLGYDLASELFNDVEPIGQKISVGTTKLTIVGIMKEKGLVSGVDYDSNLYTPFTVVNKYLMPNQFARMIGGRINMIFVKVEDQELIPEIIQQITILLCKRHEVALETPDFSITTQEDIISTQEATTESFRSLLGWVAGVSLIVGGIGIMNIMLVSVTERTREIGIRQSVGATPSDIRWQFLSEAMMLSLIGGIIGVITGILGSWIFGKFGGMRTVILPGSIALAFFSAAAVGIFFGYVPANQASKLDPIEALRHE